MKYFDSPGSEPPEEMFERAEELLEKDGLEEYRLEAHGSALYAVREDKRDATVVGENQVYPEVEITDVLKYDPTENQDRGGFRQPEESELQPFQQ